VKPYTYNILGIRIYYTKILSAEDLDHDDYDEDTDIDDDYDITNGEEEFNLIVMEEESYKFIVIRLGKASITIRTRYWKID
jgi:hypothetical protein